MELIDISKSFCIEGRSELVLDNFSLRIGSNEIVSVIGKSGCGKSTLLNIISGLDSPTSGKIITKGRLTYVQQRDLLLPWRNALENVLLPLEIRNAVTPALVEQAHNLLRQLDLGKSTSKYPSELSGGMRQKVSMVRALLQDCQILLFDEPFSAIDFDTRLQLVRRVRNYIIGSGRLALFVTHNIEEAISVADRVLVLGSKPGHILLVTEISIPEALRDPISVRKTSDFQILFETIWKTMNT